MKKTLLFAISALAACSPERPPERPAAPHTRYERAVEAKELLFGRLFARLGEVMKTGGPASAVEVCANDAPKLAAAVAEERDLRIGRTSTRLRNSKNKAPAWAAQWVERNVAEAHRAELGDGRLGVLLPITIKAKCLTCHGPKERLAPDVRAALAAGYPDDRATGYHVGDLRGWFWIEVR